MRKAISLTSLVVIIGLCVAVALEARAIADLSQRLQRAEAATMVAERLQKIEKEEAQKARADSEVFKDESKTLREQIAGGGSPSGQPAGTDVAGKKSDPGADWSKTFGKMFADPEMKKMMRTQQGMAVRMMYADFVKQLGLSPEAGDRLMELLADRQMETSSKSMALMSGKRDPKQLADAGKEVNDAKAGFDAKIKDVIGADGYSQFEQYERTMGDRMLMQQYQQQFAASGQSLQDGQRDALLQIMTDERLKSPPTPFDTNGKDPAAQIQALQSDQALHDYIASQDDYNRRVLDKAGQVLSPDQLVAFQKIQQQMSEMQQMGIKMGRSMFQQK